MVVVGCSLNKVVVDGSWLHLVVVSVAVNWLICDHVLNKDSQGMAL